jgi:DNA-directed RNA polymerase specialized sigma24 family protein
MCSKKHVPTKKGGDMFQRQDIQVKLKAIAHKLAKERYEAADLYQEMIIHLWQIQQEKPDNTESWYLKSCAYFARDLMRKGKSIDSKQRDNVLLISLDNHSKEDAPRVEIRNTCDFRSDIIAKDLYAYIARSISKFQSDILQKLMQGYTVTEIARLFHKSHQYISKEKKTIAAIATRAVDFSNT